MNDEHEELEEIFGSEDATLRLALAEAQMEISLLKIELMQTRRRLEKAEATLVSRSRQSALEPAGAAPKYSQIVEKTQRTSAPPSVRPKDTVCSPSHFPALSREGSARPKIDASRHR